MSSVDFTGLLAELHERTEGDHALAWMLVISSMAGLAIWVSIIDSFHWLMSAIHSGFID